MSYSEKNLDVLQNLEFAIVEVWRAHPEMTDFTAQNAYETACQLYRAEQRGHTPKTVVLTGLDAIAFEAVKQICEARLGRSSEFLKNVPIEPIPVETLVDCLRTLSRSVERHTKISGRQGYLGFIDKFLP